MKLFNESFARKITSVVATMWCAYAFAALALYGFPFGSHNPKELVAWFAQTFLQLVLLSIILVGQKLNSQKLDDHHQDIKHMHKETQDHIHAQIEEHLKGLRLTHVDSKEEA